VSPAVKERRSLARQLAAELADPPRPHIPGHDLVSAYSLDLPIDELPAVHNAVYHAVRDTTTRLVSLFPHALVVVERADTVVMLANTDDYSIVARTRGGDASPILVLVDVLPDHAIRVDRDSSVTAITACVDLIGELTVKLPRCATTEPPAVNVSSAPEFFRPRFWHLTERGQAEPRQASATRRVTLTIASSLATQV